MFPHEDVPAQPRPQSYHTPPFLSSDSSQSQVKFNAGGEILSGVPRPSEALHEPPIPPFLSKTYDLVDDPSLDYVISWGEKGRSFVVWDPLEFARIVLPRNFKHKLFASSIHMDFAKLTDKWEFANDGFIRGQRHLLRKIQRRKSHQSHHFSCLSSPSNKANNKAALEGEVEGLRKERSLMLREVVELQHQHRGTIQHMEVVKEKLEAAEIRQKQMFSFLARMFRKPAFLSGLRRPTEGTKDNYFPKNKTQICKTSD